jgi:hypothetical protein
LRTEKRLLSADVLPLLELDRGRASVRAEPMVPVGPGLDAEQICAQLSSSCTLTDSFNSLKFNELVDLVALECVKMG